MKKIEVPDKDVLYKLYTTDNKSMSDIAVIYNTSTMTVRSWLNNLKIITKISNVNIYKELRTTDFSKNQIDLLIGSIMGDGNLRIPKHGKNASFSERHCEEQRMYLEWKRNLLMPFVQSDLCIEEGGVHTISGIECIVQKSYKLATVSHPFLTDLWMKFYKGNGKKILPDNFDELLNLFILAVWICDDGSLVWNSIRRNYRIDLHTENFTYDEIVKIVRTIHTLFDGNIIIIPRKYESGIKYYISLRGKKELHSICKIMIDFVPECMKYKFITHI
jgi:LAGLIDADG DNA endonuclease family